MEIDLYELGKKISKARIRKDLTQEVLAEKLDITNTFLSNIETGKRKMSFDTLILVAEELDLSLDYLIFGENVEKDENYKLFIKQIYRHMEKLNETNKQKLLDILDIIVEILVN